MKVSVRVRVSVRVSVIMIVSVSKRAHGNPYHLDICARESLQTADGLGTHIRTHERTVQFI
jgi:hypothetical protein